MKRQHQTTDLTWSVLLKVTRSRSKFFLKHGERFDRKLYAEVESIVRISLKLRALNVIESNPEMFGELLAVERELLRLGQDEYLDFP